MYITPKAYGTHYLASFKAMFVTQNERGQIQKFFKTSSMSIFFSFSYVQSYSTF